MQHYPFGIPEIVGGVPFSRKNNTCVGGSSVHKWSNNVGEEVKRVGTG